MMKETGSQSAEYKPLGQEEQQLHQINIQADSTSMGLTNYMVPPESLQGFNLIIPQMMTQMMAQFPWQHFFNQVLATHQGASNGNQVIRTEEDLTKSYNVSNLSCFSQQIADYDYLLGNEQQLEQIIIPAASTSMPQRWNETGSQSAESKPLGQEQQINIPAASTSMETNYMVPPESLQGFNLIPQMMTQMMAQFPWQHFINQVLATHQGASNGNLVIRTEEDLTKSYKPSNLSCFSQRIAADYDFLFRKEQQLDQINIPAVSTSIPQRWNETGSHSASTSEPGQEQQLYGIIQADLTSTLPPSNVYNLPRSDLLYGTRGEYLRIGVPLYEASIRCDWNAAKAIILKYPEMQLVRCSITENNETALHVAASLKRSNRQVENFVMNLVALMTDEDLELQNSDGDTALFLAAAAGNIKTVKIMGRRSWTLSKIPGRQGMMPLYVAALFRNYQVVKFLYEYSNDLRTDGWTPQNRGELLEKCVEADMFDVALEIVRNYPGLGSGSIVESGKILGALARKPYAFSVTKSNIIERITSPVFALIGLRIGAYEKESEALQLLKLIWEDIAKRPKEDIDDILRGPADPVVDYVDSDDSQSSRQLPRIQYSSRLMFIAAEMGNTTFLVELIRRYPDLIWKVNDHNMSIFHIAVKYRHEDIYNLLYEIGSMRDKITPLTDDNYNNMLHLVGKRTTKVGPADVSGPALHMQRELLWFKEVRSMLPPYLWEQKNKDGQTPHALFIEEHKELIKEGEKWLKETASQCMVVAALIATIGFGAAFTIPGGYNQTDGIPIFYQKPNFVVFIVADAMSLLLSTTSILTFLSILTSRYAECDFEESLPTKLMLCIWSLLTSIAAMMTTFGAGSFVLYDKKMKQVPILIGLFALMPINVYILLQYHVLVDVFHSTFGSKYLFKPGKQVLYHVNPRV